MNKNNKIIFFIGPSGSGKDTFLAYTLEHYNIKPIILLTTRPKRSHEVEGREYYFISSIEMDNLEKKELLIERRDYTTVHGIWSYATGKEQIDLENYNYCLANTWEGYNQFLNVYSPDQLVPIYFQMDDGIRLQRCLDREKKLENGKYAEMCRRFLADAKDFTEDQIIKYKPFIVYNNNTIADTTNELDNILEKKLKLTKK